MSREATGQGGGGQGEGPRKRLAGGKVDLLGRDEVVDGV